MYTTLRTSLLACYPAGEASAIARMVLTECFGISQTDIYMGKDIQLSEDDEHKLENILQRLKNYEPVQYILGRAPFCGRDFHVAPGVLIPRPETEELIEIVLRDHPTTPPQRILDIGTGSGCIPITLAHHWPQSHVEGWDISHEALSIARINDEQCRTHVHFVSHDVLHMDECEEGGFDLIVSNPPYIKQCERAQMERNVLDWEPSLALFVPDEDPLLFYRTIVQHAVNGLLNPNGWLYFEINREHGADTARLLEENGFSHVQLLKDLSGNDRIVKGTLTFLHS